MKIYYDDTPNCYKVCAVAKHLKLPVEFVRVNLGNAEHKEAEFLLKNPNGKLPVLERDTGSTWESMAIMCQLARKADSDIWPNDNRQIDVLRWLSWDMDHFLPAAGVYYFQNIIKPKFSLGEPDQDAIEAAYDNFSHYAGILNNHLKDREYMVGDGLTLADFSVAALLPYAEKAEIPLDNFSEIQRWHNNLMKLPAWQQPFPETH